MLYRIFLIFCSWILFTSSSYGASLENRLDSFPQWHQKPSTKIAKGDLYYPMWMGGDWQVTSTLIQQLAPLAPDVASPGFANNQDYLNQDIKFNVRFVKDFSRSQQSSVLDRLKTQTQSTLDQESHPPARLIIADRVYNSMSIAKTYLGEKQVVSVKVDPLNPNKQITVLEGDRQLISQVKSRASEQPEQNRFLTSEVANQVFKSPTSIYLNQVETTSDYRLIDSDQIEAKQITAIYLSPQDPDFFKAGSQPIALYLYQLRLHKLNYP